MSSNNNVDAYCQSYLYVPIEEMRSQLNQILQLNSTLADNIQDTVILNSYANMLKKEIDAKTKEKDSLIKAKNQMNEMATNILNALRERENYLNKRFDHVKYHEIRNVMKEVILNSLIDGSVKNEKNFIGKLEEKKLSIGSFSRSSSTTGGSFCSSFSKNQSQREINKPNFKSPSQKELEIADNIYIQEKKINNYANKKNYSWTSPASNEVPKTYKRDFNAPLSSTPDLKSSNQETKPQANKSPIAPPDGSNKKKISLSNIKPTKKIDFGQFICEVNNDQNSAKPPFKGDSLPSSKTPPECKNDKEEKGKKKDVQSKVITTIGDVQKKSIESFEKPKEGKQKFQSFVNVSSKGQKNEKKAKPVTKYSDFLNVVMNKQGNNPKTALNTPLKKPNETSVPSPNTVPCEKSKLNFDNSRFLSDTKAQRNSGCDISPKSTAKFYENDNPNKKPLVIEAVFEDNAHLKEEMPGEKESAEQLSFREKNPEELKEDKAEIEVKEDPNHQLLEEKLKPSFMSKPKNSPKEIESAIEADPETYTTKEGKKRTMEQAPVSAPEDESIPKDADPISFRYEITTPSNKPKKPNKPKMKLTETSEKKESTETQKEETPQSEEQKAEPVPLKEENTQTMIEPLVPCGFNEEFYPSEQIELKNPENYEMKKSVLESDDCEVTPVQKLQLDTIETVHSIKLVQMSGLTFSSHDTHSSKGNKISLETFHSIKNLPITPSEDAITPQKNQINTDEMFLKNGLTPEDSTPLKSSTKKTNTKVSVMSSVVYNDPDIVRKLNKKDLYNPSVRSDTLKKNKKSVSMGVRPRNTSMPQQNNSSTSVSSTRNPNSKNTNSSDTNYVQQNSVNIYVPQTLYDESCDDYRKGTRKTTLAPHKRPKIEDTLKLTKGEEFSIGKKRPVFTKPKTPLKLKPPVKKFNFFDVFTPDENGIGKGKEDPVLYCLLWKYYKKCFISFLKQAGAQVSFHRAKAQKANNKKNNQKVKSKVY